MRQNIVKLLFDVDNVKALMNVQEVLQQALNKETFEQKESRLLSQLNNECVLPEREWRSFMLLTNKREQTGLTDEEQAQLDALIKSEETLQLKRIQVLGELSKLRGISLVQIVEELDIKPLSYA